MSNMDCGHQSVGDVYRGGPGWLVSPLLNQRTVIHFVNDTVNILPRSPAGMLMFRFYFSSRQAYYHRGECHVIWEYQEWRV